jgi:hypothetical protein
MERPGRLAGSAPLFPFNRNGSCHFPKSTSAKRIDLYLVCDAIVLAGVRWLARGEHYAADPKPSRRNPRPFAATLPESVRGYL